MTFEIEFSLKGAFREDAEVGAWVAYCPALAVYSQGRDQSEAQTALVDAAQSFITTCMERRILERVLTKRGFKASPETPEQQRDQRRDEKAEWIAIRQQYDKGEFEFKVSIPYHTELPMAQSA